MARVEGTYKFADSQSIIRCASGPGLVRIEAWKDVDGNVVRFNLAFINFHLSSKDNGRVLGYDTAHGQLHRHFAGDIKLLPVFPYDEILERFLQEVGELKTRKRL